jgi:hypothetical protein
MHVNMLMGCLPSVQAVSKSLATLCLSLLVAVENPPRQHSMSVGHAAVCPLHRLLARRASACL